MNARVLFVDHTAVLGGGELSLRDICARSGAAGAVLLLSDGPFRGLLESAGVPVQVLELGGSLRAVRRDGAGRSAAAAAGLAAATWKLTRVARGFDLVYANSQKAFVISALAARLARRPVIWHLRDILSEEHFDRGNIRLVTRLANLCATRVIANSRATAAAFMEQGGRADKVRVVHNGIDPTDFARVTEADVATVRGELGGRGCPLVGVFGRFHPWKGQHVAMDVLARLPGVHGLFVGDALFGEQDYVAQVRSQARELGLEERVHFLGFRSDIPRLMRAVDIVLHTAEAPEPFGRVLVEAMLAGRPVVTGRAGGAVEIVVEGETGLLVTPGDVEGYAAAVRSLLADPERRAALGAAGAQRAVREFSLDAMVRGVSEEMEAATTGRGPRIAAVT